MWQIDKNFDDYTRPHNKGKIVLNADQVLHPHAVSYPLVWSGMLNGEEIVIYQIEASSQLMDSYEFRKFPEEYNHLKTEIVDWIDDKLKTMD